MPGKGIQSSHRHQRGQYSRVAITPIYTCVVNYLGVFLTAVVLLVLSSPPQNVSTIAMCVRGCVKGGAQKGLEMWNKSDER